jgi:hypothetical protein
MKLSWDNIGERFFETGVDKGVLYMPNSTGVYTDGVAWNGLVNVTESPSGAEANKLYADNTVYLNMTSAEEFGASIEAYTYPAEFDQYDGLASPTPGLRIGQQARKPFGLSYRTRVGNDLDGDAHGYKIHLVYGCTAAPSERAYATVNDSPEPVTFSWELTTVPVSVSGLRPTALVTVTSTEVSPTELAAFEDIIYGTAGTDPRLPLPDEVVSIFETGVTIVTPTAPTKSGNNLTIPNITGVTYSANGITVDPGVYAMTEDTMVEAMPTVGYIFPSNVDTDWGYDYI